MSWYTMFSGILAGSFILSGFFSLFLFFRRIERGINLPYFFLAVSLTCALLFGLLHSASSDVAVMLRYDRMMNLAFLGAGMSFVFMTRALTGWRNRPFLFVIVGCLALFALVAYAAPYGINLARIDGVESYRLLWGETRHRMIGPTGWLNYVTIALILLVLAYAVLAIAHQLREGDPSYARLLLGTVIIGISGILVDTLLIGVKAPETGLIDDIGFFAFIVLVGHRNYVNLIRSGELIRESRDRFLRLTEATFEGICFAEEGRITDVNWQLCAMLGYEPEEFIGRQTLDFITPPFHAFVRGKIAAGVDYTSEMDLIRKDGSFFPVEVRVRNARLDSRPLRVIVVRDLTKRRQAESENVLLAQTLRSVRDCISITDLEENLIFVNDAFLQTYGYREEDILGRNIAVVRASREGTATAGGILPGTREGGWHGEVLNRRKDGSEFPIELWTSVVHDDTGQPLAYVGVARDISDRRQSEEALIAAKERAERSDRLKDAFIANISHEVRTPLNIILGYVGLIGESIAERGDETEQVYYESVQRGAQRLMRTVDMILSISRLQVGDIETQPVRLDLARLTREIVHDYQSAAQKKGIALHYDHDGSDAAVLADEHCLMQSLHNLMDNALKYTPEGSITVRVGRGTDDTVHARIIDTGVGISEEYLPTVFQPYTQEDTGYSRGYEGIGLGLSLVKRYAELNHAKVELASEKGRGTTASLLFPHADRLVLAAEGGAASDSGQKPPLSVLLVEDDMLTIQFMRTIIGKDCVLREARSADDAMEVLEREEVGIVLMDISLSGPKNGLELTRELKESERWGALPVVVITAHAFALDRQRCMDAGCDAFLTKPVSRSELVATIEEVLGEPAFPK